MLQRRQLLQLAGAAAVAGAGGAAWMAYRSDRATARVAGSFKNYPFDPVDAANFQQKLFMPGAGGPLGVLDVAGPVRIQAGAASFALLPQRESPLLLYQTDYAGKAYQNPILRIESGARFTATLDNAQFDAQGKLLYKPGMQEAMMGWLGDIILCNLTPNAVQSVMPRTYRLRLLNGSNSRIYRLGFVNGHTALGFTVIGTDGGLLERPEAASEAFIAPGERLDVLFDADQVPVGGDIFLKSLAFDAMENEGGMPGMSGMPGMGPMMNAMSSSRLPLGAEFNILKLSVLAGERVIAQLPTALSSIKPIATAGAAERTIELSMGQMRFLINGLTFRMDEIAFDVKRNAVEVWSISNPAIGMPHPMHIHGFSFQVLERIGSPPQMSAAARFGKGRVVSDLGWKDTVLVWPGETVRIALDFTHDFPGDQTYVFHCHNLEHEDAGMMINFRVTA